MVIFMLAFSIFSAAHIMKSLNFKFRVEEFGLVVAIWGKDFETPYLQGLQGLLNLIGFKTYYSDSKRENIMKPLKMNSTACLIDSLACWRLKVIK